MATRYTPAEAKQYLGRDAYRVYSQEEALRLRNQPVNLTLHKPAPGTIKLANGYFTPEIRLEAYDLMVECQQNHRACERKFRQLHPGLAQNEYPSAYFFRHNYKKMKEKKTVMNTNKLASRPRPVLTDAKLHQMEVRRIAEDGDRTLDPDSCRRNSLNLHKSTYNRGTQMLGFHPYHLGTNHVIPDRAKPQRYQSALAMEALYQQDPTLLNNLYMLDETTYTIHWRPAPHTQNRYGLRKRGNNGGGRPNHHYHTRSLSQKLHFCLAAAGDGTVDLFFFDQPIMDGAAFFRMLRDQILPALMVAARLAFFATMIFIMDGAPYHGLRVTYELLFNTFGADRVWALNRFQDLLFTIQWPPYSPDLTVCDYFLNTYVKTELYKASPRDLPHAKLLLVQIVADINVRRKQMVRNAIHSQFIKRVRACIAARGGHIEGNFAGIN